MATRFKKQFTGEIDEVRTYDGEPFNQQEINGLKNLISNGLPSVYVTVPSYKGRFLDNHPNTSTLLNGDWWVLYALDDTPIQRGVYINLDGNINRLTGDSGSEAQYFVDALPDILWCSNNGYGVVADYGDVTYIANLAANSIFTTSLRVGTGNLDSTIIQNGKIKTSILDVDTILGTSAVFKGSLDAATGTFAGSLSAATGTFSGSLNAASGSFAGSLSGATGTFSGALSGATGTFSGDLTAGFTNANELRAPTIYAANTVLLNSSGIHSSARAYINNYVRAVKGIRIDLQTAMHSSSITADNIYDFLKDYLQDGLEIGASGTLFYVDTLYFVSSARLSIANSCVYFQCSNINGVPSTIACINSSGAVCRTNICLFAKLTTALE